MLSWKRRYSRRTNGVDSVVNKRLDRLMDAMVPLAAADPAWHLDIAGVPGDHSADDLAAMVRARGLELAGPGRDHAVGGGA